MLSADMADGLTSPEEPTTGRATAGRSMAAAGQAALDRFSSFRFVYLAIFSGLDGLSLLSAAFANAIHPP